MATKKRNTRAARKLSTRPSKPRTTKKHARKPSGVRRQARRAVASKVKVRRAIVIPEVPGRALVLSMIPRLFRIGAPAFPGQFNEHGEQPRPDHIPDLSLVLVPGVNDVLAHAWEVASRIDLIGYHVKRGNLKLIATRLPDDTLAALTPKKAIEVVGDTLNRKLLERWKSEDKRASVIASIDARLTTIAEMVKPKDGETKADASVEVAEE